MGPIMVMINKLDLPADSDRVMYVRFAFWSMVALNILVYLGIWLLIGRTTDNTEIYAKPPKGKSMVADESGAVYQKTTYQETEKSLCSNKFFETILGACISTAISSYFKIPSAMIMQLFYIPANTWDCPLFKCCKSCITVFASRHHLTHSTQRLPRHSTRHCGQEER